MAEEAPEDLTAAEAEVLPQTAEEKVHQQNVRIRSREMTAVQPRLFRGLHCEPAWRCKCSQRAPIASFCPVHHLMLTCLPIC